jgi:hypothetical protein
MRAQTWNEKTFELRHAMPWRNDGSWAPRAATEHPAATRWAPPPPFSRKTGLALLGACGAQIAPDEEYDVPVAAPLPEDYKTGAEYRWARHLWRRRTGGSLITTAALALVVGGLSGSAVLAMLTLTGALGAHLYLRHTR